MFKDVIGNTSSFLHLSPITFSVSVFTSDLSPHGCEMATIALNIVFSQSSFQSRKGRRGPKAHCIIPLTSCWPESVTCPSLRLIPGKVSSSKVCMLLLYWGSVSNLEKGITAGEPKSRAATSSIVSTWSEVMSHTSHGSREVTVINVEWIAQILGEEPINGF